jgi:hypothetical protein
MLLFASLLWSGIASAQTIITGAASGTITDPTGKVVPSAVVTLQNVATREVRTTTSSKEGHFLFALLQPGNYMISLEHPGFRRVRHPENVLLGQTTPVDIKLEIGSVSEMVEVTAQTEPLQTENGNGAMDVNAKTLENTPIPGNDLGYIIQFARGVTMNTSSAGGFGSASSSGLPATSNLYTINGNDYNDPFFNTNNSGSSNLLLGLNEVAEVAIVTNGYTGQYVRQAGVQVDVTTLSGRNSFHGDLLYEWNGSALNARDFFGAGFPTPFENNNQWGARFGGPINNKEEQGILLREF